MGTINKKQILIGTATLIIGLLIYFIDRQLNDTYLVYQISKGISLNDMVPGLFGPFGGILPAFIHVFSFSLITAGLLGCGKKGYILISSSWLAIDLAFEFGQKFDILASGLIPNFFSGIPFLEASKDYFISGAFDYYDLAAIVLGATAACLIIFKTIERREYHEI